MTMVRMIIKKKKEKKKRGKKKERHCVNGRGLRNRRNDDGEANENKVEEREGRGGGRERTVRHKNELSNCMNNCTE